MAKNSKRNRQRKQKREGLLTTPEREKYSKGGIIIDLVAKLLNKSAKATKKSMAERETTLQQLQQVVAENPQALDEMPQEVYEDVINLLPQKVQANLGAADEPLDNMAETLRSMPPEEVARNLELFNDMDEIVEYTTSLPAQDARKFMDNLSDEDKLIFDGQLPDIQSTLGPREVRGNFVEGGEVPVDTYPNIPPEEMAAAQASQLPDEQMEDEYITYVMNEALDQEEQMYLMNALEGDPQLSMIFDKVVDTASEFTGSGEVAGPGTGVSDSIPARLSDGEFVMTRKATDQIGADRLQTMMDEAERAYDGGLMRKDEDTDIENNMNKVMMSSNQMPSLNIRQR